MALKQAWLRNKKCPFLNTLKISSIHYYHFEGFVHTQSCTYPKARTKGLILFLKPVARFIIFSLLLYTSIIIYIILPACPKNKNRRFVDDKITCNSFLCYLHFFADSHQSYMSLSSNKKNCRMYSHLSLKNLDSEHIHTMDVMHHLNHILSK